MVSPILNCEILNSKLFQRRIKPLFFICKDQTGIFLMCQNLIKYWNSELVKPCHEKLTLFQNKWINLSAIFPKQIKSVFFSYNIIIRKLFILKIRKIQNEFHEVIINCFFHSFARTLSI